MTLAIVRHHVQNYAAWRKIYQGLAPVQKAGGVLEESVYQDKDDANEVVVLHRFANRATADAFLGGAELREAMQRAGVVGKPSIEVFEDAQTLAPSAS
jgi:quinol monooxygenase YgiN